MVKGRAVPASQAQGGVADKGGGLLGSKDGGLGMAAGVSKEG